MRRVRVSTLISCLFLAFGAEVEVAFSCYMAIGEHVENVPCTVDLSDQFSHPSTKQRWSTCHIHSAVSIVEAACKRKYGIQVDLSEAYLYYRHLQARLAQVKELSPPSFYEGLYSLDAPFAMGGNAEETVHRILEGSVCTEKEFASVQEFTDEVHQAVIAAKWKNLPAPAIKNPELTEIELNADQQFNQMFNSTYLRWVSKRIPRSRDQSYLSDLKNEIDQIALTSRLTPSNWSEQGFSLLTEDFELHQCLTIAPLKFRTESFSFEKAVHLLMKGIPFICEGNMFYKTHAAEQSGHSVVVKGYSVNKSGRGFRVLIRDSNLTQEVSSDEFPDDCAHGFSYIE